MATHVSLHIAISLFYRRLSSLIISSSRLITTYTKATNSLACVEKVQHFTNTIEEENYSYPNLAFKEFQTEGSIVFHNVSMRYRKENALALDSISFGIKPGQKCAIIGKTASGKSSIFNCLLRFQEIEKDLQNSSGIYLDGIDIREIPLTTLRKCLSYIPQQPTLFLGTLRENLDFNSSLSDSEIIQVLDKVGLTEVLHHKILNESSKFDNILDYKILDDANNFSQGEKQLICLARCILKKSKIILMDEATSNIDNYTDVQIQKTLRGPLFENCTIITIAHRIATVKDYDKMILLSNGQVLMDDIPEVVLRQFETHVMERNKHFNETLRPLYFRQ
ncbi:hypothetical protein C9374_005255 [Naegleria lovaniensis]|uniref:ABC transporter domain-containing protein n=1 Tax=Naegleria lovaniensis TaxID=51637 RepID=A0AA88GLY8_NAELO|nr:uncharacterized protein C9374_005255 [Naegleria lovaniensis]KAG2382675.1 hypothetical protein C9374_005255 [Naegleria lovaniensis]